MLATQRGPGKPTLSATLVHFAPPSVRHPQIAVVGAGVQHIGVARRLGEGGGRAALGAADLRRDRLQVVALVDRAEDIVAAAVEDVRIVAGQDERRVPVEAIGGLPLGIARPNARDLAGAQVAPADVPVLRFIINEVGVLRIDSADEAVAAADEDPVLIDRPLAIEACGSARPNCRCPASRHRPGTAGAESTRHMIELADGHVVEELPVGHAVVGRVDSRRRCPAACAGRRAGRSTGRAGPGDKLLHRS